MRVMRLVVTLCLLSGLGLGHAVANPYAMGGGYAQQPSAPGRLLQEKVDRLTRHLAANQGANPAAVRAYLEREVAPFFDFDTMARWAAGRYGRAMDARTQHLFTAWLRDSFLDAMAERLAGFPIGDVQYLPPRGDLASGRMVLGLRVEGPGIYPVELDFRLLEGPDGWRVVDVAANGASAVQHYRQRVQQLVSRLGVEGALRAVVSRP